jgi:glycosyltransferase involved in cell wall biosynthesis
MADQQENSIRPTTIVHVAASTAMGGAEQVIFSLASAIDRNLFQCRFVLFVDVRRPPCELQHMLQGRSEDVVVINIRRTLEVRQIIELYRVLKASQPHVLHTHGYRCDMLGLVMARLLHIPVVSTVHGWTSATARLRFYEWCHRWVLRYFDGVITVSDSIRQILLRSGVHSGKIVKLNNALDTALFVGRNDGQGFREEVGICQQARVIGTVGRLSSEKGLDDFLKAGARLIARDPTIILLIVGDGPERWKLEALADSLGIAQAVVFCGYRRDVLRIYPALDLFVLPSLTEGIPIALLEAMASGKPVVASNVGGIPEVVEDGVTGLLVPPRDVNQLADKMWSLLITPDAAVELGGRARRCVENQFDVRQWIKRIEGMYLVQTGLREE